MKINVPVELDVELTPTQIYDYVKDYIYSILERHKPRNCEDFRNRATIKDELIFWKNRIEKDGWIDYEYQEIVIPDKKVFNLCKSGIELLEAYEEIANKAEYMYIN